MSEQRCRRNADSSMFYSSPRGYVLDRDKEFYGWTVDISIFSCQSAALLDGQEQHFSDYLNGNMDRTSACHRMRHQHFVLVIFV